MSFSQLDFRHCMGNFASGIAIATTSSDKYYGITVNSFSSLSLEPPLILFCLDKSSGCHNAFINSENFAVSFLEESQKNISQTFAQPGEKNWDSVDYFYSPNKKQPVINNCLSYMECELHRVYDGGDHSIIIGEVIHLELISKDALPLVYFKGKYSKLSE